MRATCRFSVDLVVAAERKIVAPEHGALNKATDVTANQRRAIYKVKCKQMQRTSVPMLEDPCTVSTISGALELALSNKKVNRVLLN